MTGRVIGRLKSGGHRCQPPCANLDVPAEPLGTAWRCDCRKIWLVAEPPQVRYGQQRVAPLWRPATWRERRRLTP